MNREEVTAVACDYRDRVLEYLRGNTEDPEVEKHLEECGECRALVEGYLEKEKELDIPEAGYGGTDEGLKERVVHFEKGTRRILVFTLVGFVLGWFSITYFTDSFLVTKVILAIPYKASEMLHNLFHAQPYGYYSGNSMFTEFNEFFPGRGLLTFLAERITPVMIGGAVYGSLAYFTGDSKIFTLRRYLKFAAVWAAVVLLWTGALLKADTVMAAKDDCMEDVTGFFLATESRGNGYYEEDEPGGIDTIFRILRDALYQDGNPLERLSPNVRVPEDELQLRIFLGKYRQDSMICEVNPKEHYLVTEHGTVYRVPEEFSRYMVQYQEDCLESLYDEYDGEEMMTDEETGGMEN